MSRMPRMGFLAGVRRGGRHTIGRSALLRRAIASYLSVLSVACHAGAGRMWVKLLRLFLAKFLESRIAAERVEHGIESKQRRSERWHGFSEGAFIRYRQKFS